MITDRDAFIRAIVENPADDQPRLIYGDWLREHGEDDRAEFIDVQCELARTDLLPAAHVYVGRGDRCGRDEVTGRLDGSNLDGVIPGALVDWTAEGVDGRPGESWSGVGLVERMGMDDHGLTVRIIPWYGQRRISQRCDALRRRERELLDAHGGTWFRWLPRPDGYLGGWSYGLGPVATGGPDNPSLHAVVRRGFVESVTLAAADWLAHADALAAAAALREVTLTTWLIPGRDWFYTIDRPRKVRLAGRQWHDEPPDELGSGEWVAALLRLYWPRIRFALPNPVEDDVAILEGDGSHQNYGIIDFRGQGCP